MKGEIVVSKDRLERKLRQSVVIGELLEPEIIQPQAIQRYRQEDARRKVMLSQAELNQLQANQMGWFVSIVLAVGVVGIGLIFAGGYAISAIVHPTSSQCLFICSQETK